NDVVLYIYVPHPLLDLLFFFVMLRPPLASPLFPYTTLFRSQNLEGAQRDAVSPQNGVAQKQPDARPRAPRRLSVQPLAAATWAFSARCKLPHTFPSLRNLFS